MKAFGLQQLINLFKEWEAKLPVEVEAIPE
jgi:hypothetical protein